MSLSTTPSLIECISDQKRSTCDYPAFFYSNAYIMQHLPSTSYFVQTFKFESDLTAMSNKRNGRMQSPSFSPGQAYLYFSCYLSQLLKCGQAGALP